jgi:hypothetical protein
MGAQLGRERSGVSAAQAPGCLGALWPALWRWARARHAALGPRVLRVVVPAGGAVSPAQTSLDEFDISFQPDLDI